MSNGTKIYQAEKIISISRLLFSRLPPETLKKIQPYFIGEAICPPKVYFEFNEVTEKLLTGK